MSIVVNLSRLKLLNTSSFLEERAPFLSKVKIVFESLFEIELFFVRSKQLEQIPHRLSLFLQSKTAIFDFYKYHHF